MLATLFRLTLFAKPYLKQVSFAVFAVLAASSLTMLMPLLLRWGIDNGIKPPSFVDTGIAVTQHVDGSATTIEVDDSAALAAGQKIQIEGESVIVESVSGRTLTVERGVDDTPRASHIVGSSVKRADRTFPEGSVSTLALVAGAILGAALLRGFFTYWMTFIGEWLAQHVAFDLRNQIYDRLQRLSYAYHDSQQTGQLMSRATQDVEATRQFFQMGIVRFLNMITLIVIAAVLMFMSDWRLALAAWTFLPFVMLNSIRVSFHSRKLWTGIQEQLGRTTTVLQENLTGVRVVKAFSRQGFEEAKFQREADELFNANYRQTRLQARNNPFYLAMGMVAQVIVLWWGATLVARGDLTAGQLVAFMVLLALLLRPMQMLGFVVQQFARASAAGTRIFEILDAESAVQESDNAIDLENIEGDIRFDHVSFGYDAISPVLSDVDFEAPPGKIVALLGPTGSGKTTVVNLLPRFYDVTGGSISIDGHDIRDVTLASLRSSIGIIQQDVFLFSATVRDNIAYGAINATYEQIIEAAKIARIHDFIMSMPDSYDTWVGERGITLSGGQKQRISIARTLLLDPKILILDDSTSSVDTQTEFLIQQALAAVMKGRTTLVIAQRLRTVKDADQILVMRDGVLAERGTHDDLIALDGQYRQIYDLELRDQEEALKRLSQGVAPGGSPPAEDGAS